MMMFACVFAHWFSCVLPPPAEQPWPLPLALVLHAVFQGLGAAIGAFSVGSIPPHTASFRAGLTWGVGVSLAVNFSFSNVQYWAALGACRGVHRSLSWRPLRPQRRTALTVRRRAAVVVLAMSAGWGTLLTGLYQHGGVTAMVNGQPTPVRFKDAVHHVLSSPAVRNLGTTLWTLLSMSGGWRAAFQQFYADLDLAGEVRARVWRMGVVARMQAHMIARAEPMPPITRCSFIGPRAHWRPTLDPYIVHPQSTACEVLGLEIKCLEDFSAVKRAHRALVLESHPDKLFGASEEQKTEAAERFTKVQQAYEHLQTLNANRKKAEGDGGNGAS